MYDVKYLLLNIRLSLQWVRILMNETSLLALFTNYFILHINM